MKLNSQCHKILLMLAQRAVGKVEGELWNDNIRNWYGEFYPMDYGRYKCFICQGSIDVWQDEVYWHGMKHLRESNLLPFI